LARHPLIFSRGTEGNTAPGAAKNTGDGACLFENFIGRYKPLIPTEVESSSWLRN
jgi:hypothetical protein